MTWSRIVDVAGEAVVNTISLEVDGGRSPISYKPAKDLSHCSFVWFVEVPVEAGRISVDAIEPHQSQLDCLKDSHLDRSISPYFNEVAAEADQVGAVFEESAFDMIVLN